jgi:uroporphyrin-III C-methyltransferase
MTPTPRGKVYLIGAGPGDPDLLTLKAVRALGAADVVLHDDLVNPEILSHARRDARIVKVGKRGGCRSTPQVFIERLLVRLAHNGKTVARVKGGDPFIFGRGGEELLALQSAGIAVEIVPGITAGLGATAAIGIPATHRDHCHGVTLVTGHTRDGVEPNWAALAHSGTTLVIYMGMANLERISVSLLNAGMSPSMPCAVVQDGTLASQRHVAATLIDLVDTVRSAKLGSPALIIVGDVARFAATNVRQWSLAGVA